MFGLGAIDRCRLLMLFSSEWTQHQSDSFQAPLGNKGEERDRERQRHRSQPLEAEGV